MIPIFTVIYSMMTPVTTLFIRKLEDNIVSSSLLIKTNK